MADRPGSSTTEPIQDVQYSIATKPVAVDASSQTRTSILYSAQTNGSAAVDNPLNSAASPKTTLFVIGNSTNQPLRFNSCSLRMQMIFHLLGNPAATAPKTTAAPVADALDIVNPAMPLNSPSWNLTGALINQIKLSINDVEVWSSIPGYFVQDFTARLLKNHSYESLNARSDMLFTPVMDDRYTASTTRTDAAIAPAAAGPVVHTIKPASYDGISAPYFGATAAFAETGFNPSYNVYGESPNTIERAKLWINDDNTHQRIITKSIPFADLFPRLPPCILSNVKQIKIEIIWTQTTDLLEHYTSTAAGIAATQGAVSVIGCQIWSDSYEPTGAQFTDLTKAREAGTTEKASFISTQVYSLAYTPSTDLIIPGITSFDSVLIMQPTRGFSNGQAAPNLVTYNSFGQTLLFGNSQTATVGAIKRFADAVSDDANDVPITDCQIQFKGKLYPASSIPVSQTAGGGLSTLDSAGLYCEYLKFCGKYDRREVSPACPEWAFKGSMPFIALRPWADGNHQSEGAGDLIIRIHGSAQASTIQCVVFRLVVIEITAAGMVNVYK